jgi:hypothetical protein
MTLKGSCHLHSTGEETGVRGNSSAQLRGSFCDHGYTVAYAKAPETSVDEGCKRGRPTSVKTVGL